MQKGFRERLSSAWSYLAGSQQAMPKAEIERDLITLETVPDIFIVLDRGNGNSAKFGANSLIDYILATGDLCDPETRQPFNEDTLQMLDIFCKRLGKPSILELKAQKELDVDKKHDISTHRNTVSSLEAIIGECVVQMYEALEFVNDGSENVEEATLRLFTAIVPNLEEAFRELIVADPESARICYSQMESYLRGPRNRPTYDKHGFLKVILQMFHNACGQPSI